MNPKCCAKCKWYEDFQGVCFNGDSINHVRDDNRIENFALMTFRAHAALHMLERINERRNKYELK